MTRMPGYKKFIVLLAVFSAFSFSVANAATTLFLTSDTPQPVVGNTVNVTVDINSDQPINAAQGTLYYPSDILQVEQVTHASSIFDIWLAEPTVNASTSQISFLGGSTNSFSGGSLPVFTVVFRVRGAGKGTVGFNSAEVIAGDGTGANILSSSTDMSVMAVTPGATSTPVAAAQTPPPPVQIKRPAAPAAKLPVAPVLSVGLYPDQSGWYNIIRNFLVQWQLPPDVSDVATALNQDPQFDPTVSEGLFDNKVFGALQEGIWYLHVRFKNSVGWGPTTHYRIGIDTTPPLPFIAKIKEGPVTEVSAPTVQFSTLAQPSGIAFYRILVDGTSVGISSSTSFVLPSLSFGLHQVSVQAVDDAGNLTESRLSVTISEPPFLVIAGLKVTAPIFFLIIIGVIVIGIIIGWGLGRKVKSRRRALETMAVRDVEQLSSNVISQLDEIKKRLDGMTSTDSALRMETSSLAEQARATAEKIKKYIMQEIEKLK